MSLDGRIRQGLVQAADTVEPNVEGDLMKVQARSRNRRRIQFAAGAVAVAAIGAFLFLGGTDLFDSTGDTAPIPPASTGGDGESHGRVQHQMSLRQARPARLHRDAGSPKEKLYSPTPSGYLGTDDVLGANMALGSLLDGDYRSRGPDQS